MSTEYDNTPHEGENVYSVYEAEETNYEGSYEASYEAEGAYEGEEGNYEGEQTYAEEGAEHYDAEGAEQHYDAEGAEQHYDAEGAEQHYAEEGAEQHYAEEGATYPADGEYYADQSDPTTTDGHEAPDKPESENPTDSIEIDWENPPQWYYRALFDFVPIGSRELGFAAGDILGIVDAVSNAEWWTAENDQGHRGLVPFNYIELAEDASSACAASESYTASADGEAQDPNSTASSENRLKAQARRDELVGAMREREAQTETAKAKRAALEAQLADIKSQKTTLEREIYLSQNISSDSFFYDLMKIMIELDLDSEIESQLSLATQALLTDIATVRERLPLLRGADAVINDFSKNLEKSLYTSTHSLQSFEESAHNRMSGREDLRTVLSAISSVLNIEPAST